MQFEVLAHVYEPVDEDLTHSFRDFWVGSKWVPELWIIRLQLVLGLWPAGVPDQERMLLSLLCCNPLLRVEIKQPF